MEEKTGCFYIVQPVPDDAPAIVKLGHTMNLTNRLKAFRNLCPMVRTVKTWQCPARYEPAAIVYIVGDCTPLGVEVFRCADLPALLERAETFFSLDTAILESMAASTKRIGGRGARLTQPEMLERISAYQRGEYKPTNKRYKWWLNKRAKEFSQ